MLVGCFPSRQTFENNKHLETSRPAPPRPPLKPPPADTTPAPPAKPAAAAAFHSVRLLPLAPEGDVAIDTLGGAPPVVPTAGEQASPPQEEPTASAFAMHDEETDWPAFRSSPVWIPNVVVTGDVEGNLPETRE
ncbi:hypothetical protein CYMTET_13090 [Cymbomonas tetramitiformis]|uniref:Uncharacterized protein n=1 Tax=Cymbomonas tetramitiformis TaxID=36881 RepID=A0AAE0GJ54_9CHLO|nr:hypothetical protein CYMTET_13090 [Cymbomonas tetramitiformis]